MNKIKNLVQMNVIHGAIYAVAIFYLIKFPLLVITTFLVVYLYYFNRKIGQKGELWQKIMFSGLFLIFLIWQYLYGYWIVGILVAAIWLLYSILAWKKHDKIIVPFYKASVCLILVISIFKMTEYTLLFSLNQRLKNKAESIELRISKVKVDQAKLKLLANDPFLVKIIEEGNWGLLSGYTRNWLNSKQFTYLVITDQSGKVVARPYQPKIIGDNYFAGIANSKNILEGKEFHTMDKGSDGRFFVASGTVIKNEDKKTIGCLFGGYLVNNSFIQSQMKGLKDNAILWDGSKKLGSYIVDKEIVRLVGNKGETVGVSKTQGIIFFGQKYNLEKIDGGNLQLIMVEKVDYRLLMLSGIIIYLLLLVLAIYIIVDKKILHKLSKYVDIPVRGNFGNIGLAIGLLMLLSITLININVFYIRENKISSNELKTNDNGTVNTR